MLNAPPPPQNQLYVRLLSEREFTFDSGEILQNRVYLVPECFRRTMSAVRGVVRHALRLGRVERNGIEAESEGVFNGHCRGIERMFAAERKVAVAERERRRVACRIGLAVVEHVRAHEKSAVTRMRSYLNHSFVTPPATRAIPGLYASPG